MDNKDTSLPPMPESDAESMQRNRYHGFYKVGSKEFWGQAEVTHHTLEDFKKCEHYFVRNADEIRCTTCHAGWQASYDVEAIDGQLYFRNERVQL